MGPCHSRRAGFLIMRLYEQGLAIQDIPIHSSDFFLLFGNGTYTGSIGKK